MLGEVPLDRVLQWREQLITDADVWARPHRESGHPRSIRIDCQEDDRRADLGSAVSKVHTEFSESSADLKVQSVPLSHVSVELGHLLPPKTWQRDRRPSGRTFGSVAPWVRAAAATPAGDRLRTSSRVRWSTCFLIDDYFSRFSSPAEVIPMVIDAAKSEGPQDRLPGQGVGLRPGRGASARSSSCSDAWSPSPFPGTTGSRPAAEGDRLADQRPAIPQYLTR